MTKDLIKDSFKGIITVLPKELRDFPSIHLSFYFYPAVGTYINIFHLYINLCFNYTLFFKNIFNKNYKSSDFTF